MHRNLLIRADANTRTGSGHVMRCLALAQVWQQTVTGKVTFVLADSSSAMLERLHSAGCTTSLIAHNLGSVSDLKQTIGLATELGADWVVIDGYHFDAHYQAQVRSSGFNVLYIDDNAHLPAYSADIVLNQNYSADDSVYSHVVLSHTQLLLGTRYVLLQPYFLEWGNWKREIAEVPERLLLTLGGSDPQNVTLSILKALDQSEMIKLQIDVVVGSGNPHNRTLRAFADMAQHRTTLHQDIRNMADLMAKADLAITAGGTTLWELAFMELPTLAVILAENQRGPVETLASTEHLINLGWYSELDPPKMTGVLSSVLESHPIRSHMSRMGRLIVDGHGNDRVVAAMTGEPVLLKPAHAWNSRQIWEWANDPVTRSVSFSLGFIAWESHKKWFQDRLDDPNCRFYIAVDGDGAPIGQIRFEVEDKQAVVSINLAPEARGKGFGSYIITQGSQRLFQEGIGRIHAYVKPANEASVHAFMKAGYAHRGTVDYRGQEALDFVLSK